jgi:hypothetical protein
MFFKRLRDSWVKMYNLRRALQTVITAVLTVMSGPDPHMVSWWFGWITVVVTVVWELVLVL